jgi:hypothetical protein
LSSYVLGVVVLIIFVDVATAAAAAAHPRHDVT